MTSLMVDEILDKKILLVFQHRLVVHLNSKRKDGRKEERKQKRKERRKERKIKGIINSSKEECAAWQM